MTGEAALEAATEAIRRHAPAASWHQARELATAALNDARPHLRTELQAEIFTSQDVIHAGVTTLLATLGITDPGGSLQHRLRAAIAQAERLRAAHQPLTQALETIIATAGKAQAETQATP